MENKTFAFEKFIEDIVRREQEALKEADRKSDEDPRRKYKNLYQEKWHNRMVWRQRNEQGADLKQKVDSIDFFRKLLRSL